MLHEMRNTEANPRNPQPERRKKDRRQQEQRRDDERRRGERRENVSRMGGEMQPDRKRMTPDSLSQDSLSQDGAHGQMPEAWEGENFQSGTSQAQKAVGRTAQQQTIPAERHETHERKDFGESRDRPFGDRNRGAGGKIDSSQRDMGQTGQNMKGGTGAEIHAQQGPYGPPGKHRGPQAPGKPLMDDWGKSDKH